MSIIADGLLIVTCLTAALYCYVLSRRLRQLTDMKSGVGQQILQLNTALGETREAVKETRESAKSASERLSRELALAKKRTVELKDTIAKAEAAAKGFERRSETAVVDQASSEMMAAEEESPPDEIADTPLDQSCEDQLADAEEELGEQQLGFLPDLEELPPDDDEDDPEVAAGPGSLRAAAGIEVDDPEEAAPSMSETEPKSPRPESPKATAPESGETVMQVERMAL